jgi:hypothetical protein
LVSGLDLPSLVTILTRPGITGGEEDGVDNTGVDNNSLYTQPEDIYEYARCYDNLEVLI